MDAVSEKKLIPLATAMMVTLGKLDAQFPRLKLSPGLGLGKLATYPGRATPAPTPREQ